MMMNVRVNGVCPAVDGKLVQGAFTLSAVV